MATTSFTAMRRIAGFAFTLMLLSLCLTGQAAGQGSPLVTASAPLGLNHPTGWKTIQQTALDSNGNWLVEEFPDGGLFEFPAGGGAMVTLVPLAGLGSTNGYQNPAVLLDPQNNLYLGGNWNNCLLMFPYNAGTKSWPTLSVLTASNNSAAECGVAPYSLAQYSIFGGSGFPSGTYYFQPWGLAIGINNNIIVGSQNSGNFIFSMNVQGAWSNPSVAQSGDSTSGIIAALTKRPISIAVDPEGNVYFVEDSGGLPGVYQIPASVVAAGTAGALASDCPTTDSNGKPIGSSCLTRVDPNLSSASAVVTDAQGNLYISDSNNGVFMVPNPSGTPQTSSAVMLTPLPAQGEVAVDPVRKILYVPTTQKQVSNGQADVAMVGMSHAEFGSSSLGTTTTTALPVVFAFNGTQTPDRAIIMENGTSSANFTISGGTCAMGTPYASASSCAVNVTMTPRSVGGISAELLLQRSDPVAPGAPDSSDIITAFSTSGGNLVLTANNTLVAGEEIVISAPTTTDPLHALNGQEFNVLPAGLSRTQFTINASVSAQSGTTSATANAMVYTTISSMMLHGTGLGSLIQSSPAVESNFGSGLMTPSEMTVDGLGNTYIADPAQGKVLMYAAGSTTSSMPVSVGTGLTLPTGVAVDGAGDVFIADSGSGSVYEIPVMPPGVNAGGGQVTLASGLGTSGLSLAVDSLGDLYVADPGNARVVKLAGIGSSSAGALVQSEILLTTGFTTPSAVAVDSNNNLYVIDGANLFEVVGGIGAPTTLLNNLSGATGLAIDPSGAVYITSASGTTRIPSVGGSLVLASETTVASTVSGTSSVALDRMGNIYLVQGSGGAVTLVGVNGTLTLPTPATLTSTTDAMATITNAGNSPLTVSGYTASNPANSSQPSYLQLPIDFSVADTSSGGCVASSPLAAGANCTLDVTFNPGAGEQGTLSGTIGVTGTANNGPTTISVTGVALPLANSAATVAAAGSKAPEVVSTPVSITVTPKSGSGTPTGTVTVVYTTWNVIIPSSGSNSGIPTVNPITASVTSALTNGAASFTLAPVLAGTQTVTVNYSGDRVYGQSTGTVSLTIAKSSIKGFIGDTNPPPYLPFILQSGSVSGAIPYDGSQTYWQYSMPVEVNTLAGIPTGTVTFSDNSSTCPTGTSTTGQGAAYCLLANYSGTACPEAAGAAVVNVQYSGSQPTAMLPVTYTGTGATATFATGCLQMPEFTTYTPVVSTHYITPVYSGDVNFLGAKDNTSTLFQALRSPELLITSSPSSLTVPSGKTASSTLTLTSLLGYGYAGKGSQLNDYNFPVTLTCDNLPPHAVCSFTYPTATSSAQPSAPNSVQIPCTGTTGAADNCTSGVVTLTINTNISTGTTTSQNAATASVTLATLFGFGTLGLFFRRKLFRKGRIALMLFLIVLAGGLAISLSACNTTNLTPNAVVATPSGTYAVTVTAEQVGTQTITLATGPVQIYGSEGQVSFPFYINVTVQ